MAGEISLENVLKQCGDFGRYQWIHYLFLNLIAIVSGIATYYYVFGVAEPLFSCQQADHANTTLYPASKCLDTKGLTCINFTYDRSVFGRTFTEDANFVCDRAVMKTWLSTSYQIGG